MYIRRRLLAGKNRTKVMICRSIRKGKKISQETVKYFGIAHTDQEFQVLLKIAELELKRLTQSPSKEKKILFEEMVEESRISEGFHEIFGTFFDRINLRSHFSKLRYEQLRDVVIARIAQPVSKRHTARFLQRTRLKKISEDQIYRLMDCVLDRETVIKTNVFNTTKQLSLNETIDLLFFDVTTLYFESQKADELRDFGYGKDHKIGETQIVLALATTSEGFPIGYTLFSGKTAEVSTLIQCIEEWRKVIKIEKVTIVADRAMMSEANLHAMDQLGMHYLVAAKLKQLPTKLKNEILQRQQEIEGMTGEEKVLFKEHTHNGRRLIVNYSEKRALKDRGDRNRLLARLSSKALPNGETDLRKLVTNRGFLKFVTEKGKGTVILNEEKIAEETKWDGLHGVITNDASAHAMELISRYRQLWIIEESFRLNKHTLAMRPMYHFKPERIKAHILICYLAFAVLRYTQRQIRAFDQSLTIEKVLEELEHVESSILRDGSGQKYKVPSKMSRIAEMIYLAVGMKRNSRAQKMSEEKLAV